MSPLDRREFVWALAGAGIAANGPVAAQQSPGTSPTAADAPRTPASPPPPVTRTLARYLVSARYEELPQRVRDEATRTLLNWVGFGASADRDTRRWTSPSSALTPFSGPPQASVLGRRERLDILHAR